MLYNATNAPFLAIRLTVFDEMNTPLVLSASATVAGANTQLLNIKLLRFCIDTIEALSAVVEPVPFPAAEKNSALERKMQLSNRIEDGTAHVAVFSEKIP